MEKALGCFGLDPFGCPEPFFLVDSAKLLSVSCAAEQRATSVDDWRLVWGELGSRSGKLLGCWMGFGMPQILPYGELEKAIRDSELSGNLARELLPLPGPAVTFVPLDAPVLSKGFAAQDGRIVGRCNSESDLYLFCARWTGRFVAVSCSARLFPKPKNLAFAVGWNLSHFLSSSSSSVDLAPAQAKLGSLKLVMLAKLWRVARLL